MFKKPNFFIIGAPKCGTTSLAAWLAEHPCVYVSTPKEPEFFDHDRSKGYSQDLEQYNKLFASVKVKEVAVGEASTGYLRSKVAIEDILNYSPDARFIVGLRNPVKMAISWHGQMIFGAQEDELDFEVAWRLQEKRRAGGHLPRFCRDPKNLMYGDVCAIGSQLASLLRMVDQKRVFVYTLDEMHDQPRQLWLRILSFLGVPDDSRHDFSALNRAKQVPRALRIATRVVADAKRNFGMTNFRFGLLTTLNRKLATVPDRNLDSVFMKDLYAFFREEVELLQRLTGFDLSNWLDPLALRNTRVISK